MHSVDSAATFNADPNVKNAYEKGYGTTIGLTETATNGAVTYKTGCSVDALAQDSRRASMKVQYSSVVSVASGVNQITASQGVTDTSSFVSNVNSVISSDPTYSSVSALSANDVTSVASATSGPAPTTSAPIMSACPEGMMRRDLPSQDGLWWKSSGYMCYDFIGVDNCPALTDQFGLAANQACGACGGGQASCVDESTQKAALMEMYQEMGGASWTYCGNSGRRAGYPWGSNTSFCQWKCVTCNPYLQGYASDSDLRPDLWSQYAHTNNESLDPASFGLDFYASHLVGTFPSSLLQLGTHLIAFNAQPLLTASIAAADRNSISGSLCEQIGSLSGLRSFKIAAGAIRGTIPASIQSLSLLQRLSVANNRLSGSVPPAVFQLSQLRQLMLTFTQSAWINSGDEYVVGVNQNSFHGRFLGVSNLTRLQMLECGSHYCVGGPPGFCGSSQTSRRGAGADGTVVKFGWVNSSGMVPDTFSPDLTRFALPGNLSGTVSPNVRHATQLENFKLDVSRVSGSIPVELFNLPAVKSIALTSTSTAPLSGTVPNTMANAQNIQTVQFTKTRVSGTVPGYFERATGIENVYFADSRISGTLPNLEASNNIYDLAFKGILASGTLPESYKRFDPCVTLWVYETSVNPPQNLHLPCTCHGHPNTRHSLGTKYCAKYPSIT